MESGVCENDSDSLMLYALVSECQEAQCLIIRSRESFLRAGPPRTSASHNTDFDAWKGTWKCPYCKISKGLLSAPDLTRHLQIQDYAARYLYVLKCSSCELIFKKLSDLYEHLESTTCDATPHTGPPAALTRYLRTEYRKSDMLQPELNYGLRTDPLRPGMLYVKSRAKFYLLASEFHCDARRMTTAS